ncbi:uncharacterized protein M421DRAFT_414984 [Didymella exigua CBS 183.55]|uniref:Rhodopsin domain-containing protein n=1 Tax=Didymella exigua CBS 183.55 TaxID=1150837 RepID=A0A6A5S610_9PLEO|nr:uncharacterized protein M421DRAFT_414984 [Didymella exigua CBS 183.55]KAF1933936.1 hypothetical protein M421DRAFT_414984 [Didymella exigua CBS 183.55]
MQLPPIDVILSWPKPNYANPHTRGDALLIINSILIALAVIVVGLRMYTRLIIKRWFGLDDVFTLLALMFAVGLTTVVLLANQRYGWDRHVYDIPLNKLEPTLKVAMAAKVVFTGAATFTRLSLHCFYYRLVADTGRSWFRWCVHLNVAYTMGIFLSFPFIAIFLCTPVSDYWLIGSPPSSCLNEGTATLICGIINCVADFATTVTPIPLILGLHMPHRQRLAVAGLFAMGIIVTIAGIVRTWYIYKSLFTTYDNTWYAYPLWIAAAVEIDLGVICASAPVLRPLLSKIPFSLSGTFSGGISLKKKSVGAGSGSKRSKLSTTAAETPPINPSTTNLSSKRRSEAICAVPDLDADQGRSYELKNWDEERTISSPEPQDQTHRSASRDAMLRTESNEESSKGGGLTKMWQKMKSRWPDSEEGSNEDMTITRTSEVELSNEPASVYGTKRSSWHKDASRSHRAVKEHKLPSLPQAHENEISFS